MRPRRDCAHGRCRSRRCGRSIRSRPRAALPGGCRSSSRQPPWRREPRPPSPRRGRLSRLCSRAPRAAGRPPRHEPRARGRCRSPQPGSSPPRDSRAVAEHLKRAHAFLERADMAGERLENSQVGMAIFDDRVPRRLDCNFRRVDAEADPETVQSEAERLGRRMIHVPDSEIGERLVPPFRSKGRVVRRHLVMGPLRGPGLMAQLRDPERNADVSVVSEVDEPSLRAARHRVVTGQPWAKPEIMAELFAGKELIGQRVRARYFAVVLDDQVVSYTDLYQDGADAQIEDVGTLQEYRKRGYATAVVLAAIAAARAEGAEFVFLVADLEDWPKELYRRLGFDELGYFVKFIAPHA